MRKLISVIVFSLIVAYVAFGQPKKFNPSEHAPEIKALQDPFNLNKFFTILEEGPEVDFTHQFYAHGWNLRGRKSSIKPVYHNGEEIYINSIIPPEKRYIRYMNDTFEGRYSPTIIIHHNEKRIECSKDCYLKPETVYTIEDYFLTKEQFDLFISQYSSYALPASESSNDIFNNESIESFRSLLTSEEIFLKSNNPDFCYVLHLTPKDSEQEEYLVLGDYIHRTYEYVMMDWWKKVCEPLIGKKIAIEGSYRSDGVTLDHSYTDFATNQKYQLQNDYDFSYTIKDIYYDYSYYEGGKVIIEIEDNKGSSFTVLTSPENTSSRFKSRIFETHNPQLLKSLYRYYDGWQGNTLCFYSSDSCYPTMLPKSSYDELVTYNKNILSKQLYVEAKREAEVAQERAQKKKQYIAQYGAHFGEAISNGTVELGMNQEMCKLAWGRPLYKHERISKEGTIVTWYYGPSTRLVFTDNKLTVIYR